MGSELPVELWAKIVEQLPPPPPRLVPGIVFVPTGGIGGRGSVLHVSKAVSMEERDMLAGAWMTRMSWEDDGTHWTKGGCPWHMVTDICLRAEFMGYSYCNELERAKMDSHSQPTSRIRMSR